MRLPPLTRDGALALRLEILKICESPESRPDMSAASHRAELLGVGMPDPFWWARADLKGPTRLWIDARCGRLA